MPIKDILAVISSIENDAHVLDMAERLARDHDAHLTVLVINWSPSEPPFAEGWVIDGNWAGMIGELRKQLDARAEAVEKRLDQALDRSSVNKVLTVPALTRATVATAARHCDLTIVSRLDGAGDVAHRDEILEAALFQSGRPVLVAPPNWQAGDLGKTIAVGWNASRESARALADAGPFIKDANQVNIVTVDAKPAPYGHGDLPGGDIALHLSRHGAATAVRQISSSGRTDARALLDEADGMSADMIVVGGYGRPRWQEIIFGGVTRELVSSSELPILMSH